MKRANDFATMWFASQTDWEAWLESHHANTAGIWIKLAKKASGIPSVSYKEALETAICYGWIDGQKAALDDQHWLQRFTPRGPKSIWSRVNRDKATELLVAGRMRPAGIRQIELSQADGRWEAAYDPQSTIAVPDDFAKELEMHPPAKAFFSTLNSINRYAILHRIQTAKRPETRANRIHTFIEMLLRHEQIHP